MQLGKQGRLLCVLMYTPNCRHQETMVQFDPFQFCRISHKIAQFMTAWCCKWFPLFDGAQLFHLGLHIYLSYWVLYTPFKKLATQTRNNLKDSKGNRPIGIGIWFCLGLVKLNAWGHGHPPHWDHVDFSNFQQHTCKGREKLQGLTPLKKFMKISVPVSVSSNLKVFSG